MAAKSYKRPDGKCRQGLIGAPNAAGKRERKQQVPLLVGEGLPGDLPIPLVVMGAGITFFSSWHSEATVGFWPSCLLLLIILPYSAQVQLSFSSVAQSGPILCHHMDCSTPDIPVHHQLPEFTQTHIHWVGDAIQTISSSVIPFSYTQSFPALETFPMSQLLKSDGQSIGALALILPMNIQGWFPGWLFSPLKPVVGDNPSCPGMGESA